MKILRSSPVNRAVSMLEVPLIIAVLALPAAFWMASMHKSKNKALRITCVSKLKCVGLAFRIWAGDNAEQYPMAFYTNAAGGPAFADSSNAFRYFEVMSNELSTPVLLVCPKDRARRIATNFTSDFNNQRVSYFVGLQARESNPNLLLAGDRDLTSGPGPLDGVLTLSTNQSARWLGKLHREGGNVALTDGSVQQLTSSGLNTAVLHSGVTNRLLFP